MENKSFDVIIIGGGASGIFCATQINSPSNILIIEGSNSPAQKLSLSAKGRGNVTNISVNPKHDYVSDNITFVENAFKHYGVFDFLHFLEDIGIDIIEEDFGRILLKSNNVQDLKYKLLEICERKRIQFSYNTKIQEIKIIKNSFNIITDNGEFLTKNLVIATGGPSFPKLGASPIAAEIARSFGLGITPFYPALTGFETSQDFSSLSGSSIIGTLELINQNNNIVYRQTGPILFTHRGVSGPCVFNASLFMGKKGEYKARLLVDKSNITKRLLSFLGFRYNRLESYKISTEIKNTRGLDEAKVCGGGIKTENLNDYFECKNVPNLYFIGECLDVTGKTGGFNLQWCWTSGAICAEHLNQKFK